VPVVAPDSGRCARRGPKLFFFNSTGLHDGSQRPRWKDSAARHVDRSAPPSPFKNVREAAGAEEPLTRRVLLVVSADLPLVGHLFFLTFLCIVYILLVGGLLVWLLDAPGVLVLLGLDGCLATVAGCRMRNLTKL
jgi:hypothetical protein